MSRKRTVVYGLAVLLCFLLLGGCGKAAASGGPVVSEAPAGLSSDGAGDVITIDGGADGSTKKADGAQKSGTGSHETAVTKETQPSKSDAGQAPSLEAPKGDSGTAEPKVEGSGSGKIVAIDPGHQAKGNPEQEPIAPGAAQMKAKVASGTKGVVTGIPEYKLTLAVSLKLKDELLKRGYRVYMIRKTNDVNISNAERAKMANGSGADIFVRIHANSLSDSSVRGTLTMCQTSSNPYNGKLYSKSYALSKALAKDISASVGFQNRGVQTSDTMSGINWCRIPVSIVEMGFMSNAEEDRAMETDECQNKIVKGIADGIDDYYASGN